jgi:hypothetical protein
MHIRAPIAALMLAAAAAALGPVSGPAVGAEPKWPTDEPIRAAMAVIRKATLDNHTLVTHRRMPQADARRFAETVSREVARIKAEADLPPEGRSEFDAILADILAGAEAVAGRGGEQTPIDGIVRIDAALARYPLHFDDPTWQPLR